MKRWLLFDGETFKAPYHTWFDTIQERRADGKMLGGDRVVVMPGDAFPVEGYIEPRFVEQHVNSGSARIVESETKPAAGFVALPKAAKFTPTPKAPTVPRPEEE